MVKRILRYTALSAAILFGSYLFPRAAMGKIDYQGISRSGYTSLTDIADLATGLLEASSLALFGLTFRRKKENTRTFNDSLTDKIERRNKNRRAAAF